MKEQAGSANGPEDIDATFAEIAAALEREGLDTPWPEESDTAQWRAADHEWDWASDSDTEHFIPPEPPAMPRLRPSTVLALMLIMFGVVLLAVPALAGLDNPVATPFALITLTAGVGWLVMRMRQDPNPDAPEDDGAKI